MLFSALMKCFCVQKIRYVMRKMQRRHFLKSSLGMAGLLALQACSEPSSAVGSAPTAKSKITVGTHIWVYAKHQKNYDVSNILKDIWQDVKYAGIDGVELMEHPLRRLDKTSEIKALIEEHRLPLIGTSYGASFWDKQKTNEIVEDLDNIFTNMQTLGARTIGISVGRPNGNRLKTDEELDTQAALIIRATALAKSKGVVLNLHNHTYEVENELHDLLGTLNRIPDAKLGPDINWLLRAGVEPNEFLKRFKDNIVFLHLRDQYASGQWPESVGEGDTDFSQIASTLQHIDFKGDAIIELAHEDGFAPTRPIKESLKMSREYVRSTMGF
jgi:sugar phosphate isomerase/epimerase